MKRVELLKRKKKFTEWLTPTKHLHILDFNKKIELENGEDRI
jgi:hypothetical protein